MDWTGCPFIETVPGRLSNVPVIVGSRVRPEDLVGNIEEGPEWMAENFGLPLERVSAVLAFYHRHQEHFANTP